MYAWLRYICIILAAFNAFPNHITTHLVSEYSLCTIATFSKLIHGRRGKRVVRPRFVAKITDRPLDLLDAKHMQELVPPSAY